MIFIFQRGQPAREIVRAGFEPIATRIFCQRPPRLDPPTPQARQHYHAPYPIPRMSRK